MAIAAASLLLIAAEARGADLPGTFATFAYGAAANAAAGPIGLGLGRVAYAASGCGGTYGRTQTVNAASASAGPGGNVLRAGAFTSTLLTVKNSTAAASRSTASVANVNLFNGLITATSVAGVALLQATESLISYSDAGTQLVNLVVAGTPVSATVAPNTRITLAGLGVLTVRKVVPTGSNSSRTLTVDALSVEIGQTNSFGLPVGAKVEVGHAFGSYNRQQPPAFSQGSAFGVSATTSTGGLLDSTLNVSAPIGVGSCAGTAGVTRTANVAAANVANLISVTGGQTTAFGGPTSAGTTTQTTSTILNVNLLGGLIRAQSVKAVATETVDGAGQRTRSTDGSEFVGLSIVGVNIPAVVQPNTVINLPGIGIVILNEQHLSTASLLDRTYVNAIHIVVRTTNALGLPVGANIIVAHADASTVPSTAVGPLS